MIVARSLFQKLIGKKYFHSMFCTLNYKIPVNWIIKGFIIVTENSCYLNIYPVVKQRTRVFLINSSTNKTQGYVTDLQTLQVL